MSSKQQLTVQSLIDLLEEQRCAYTDRYLPLRTAQEIALQKANDLVAEPPDALTRNYTKKRAYIILNDIKNCISYDVFILCALATKHSALGNSKPGDYVSKIRLWWEGVHHPRGLTMVSERYGTRISNASPIEGEPLSSGQTKQSELVAPTPVGQHALGAPPQDRENLSQREFEFFAILTHSSLTLGSEGGRQGRVEPRCVPSPYRWQRVNCKSAHKGKDEHERYKRRRQDRDESRWIVSLYKKHSRLISKASAKSNTNTYDGDAFIVDINDARYALSLNDHVGEIWLTNRKNYHDLAYTRCSFLLLAASSGNRAWR